MLDLFNPPKVNPQGGRVIRKLTDDTDNLPEGMSLSAMLRGDRTEEYRRRAAMRKEQAKLLSPEQRRLAYLERKAKEKRRKHLMTPEAWAAHLAKKREQREAKLASMTPLERQMHYAKLREQAADQKARKREKSSAE